MYMDEKKNISFMKMMQKVAKERDCIIEFEWQSDDLNRLKVIIEKPAIIRREYRIVWSQETSQTEAAVAIWADFFEALGKDPVANYIRRDVEMTKAIGKYVNDASALYIKDVIFHDPATIVFWMDGTKTVVKCQEGYEFDAEKGLAMAICERAFGDKTVSHQIFRKWLANYDPPVSIAKLEPSTLNIDTINQAFESFKKAVSKMSESLTIVEKHIPNE